MEPIKIEATPGAAGVEVRSYDAQELFEQAGAALSGKRTDEAISLYDKLLTSFPDSQYARPALYNRGLALQDKKDWAGAVTTFQSFADKYRDHPDSRDAVFQLGACYAELQNWPASAEVFARALERTDLSADDRIEAMARRGFAQFNLGDLETSERTFRSVLAYRDKIAREERLTTDFFLAFAQYHLGQVTHVRFRSVPLRLPERQMDRDMEEKARLLLEAQRRYIDAIKYGHPGWASAAGFQVGSLYEELYDAFLGAPVPPDLDVTAREVYAEELRKKIRVLLEKSVRWYRENLLMMERLGARSDWAEKSKVSYAKLMRLLDPKASFEVGGTQVPAPDNAKPPMPPAPPIRPPHPDAPRDGKEGRPSKSSEGERQIL
jgi:tetratricopeptide (TPR) repeat protein